MIFHRIWDEIFSTWSHVAVLRALQDVGQGMSGREVARAAGMTHRACLQALTALENLSIVFRQRGGRDHLFSLNREHLLVSEGVIPLFVLEGEFLERLKRLLGQHLGNSCESLILFGSIARKEETITSDVDLCAVTQKVGDNERIQGQVHELTPLVKRQFGANLSVLILSKTDFASRARQKKPPVANILRDGILISGTPLNELIRG